MIGVGDDGMAGLGETARRRIDAADVIIASKRLDAMLPDTSAERLGWPSPFDPMAARIAGWKGRNIVVLASGDPMWFGAGATLCRHFAAEEMEIIPAPSAFSLAAARMGWPLQEVATVSLHGRPGCLIEPLIQPRARIIALTGGAGAVAEIAARLVARGFGGSRLTVLEHLCGERERRTGLRADEVGDKQFAALHTLAIACRADPGAKVLSCAPGLADEAYDHDGQLTKREVRAVTLAALAPQPGGLLWDVGAGCGSISIEWMRAGAGATAIAIERDEARAGRIAHNAERLGVPDLQVVHASAPAAFAGLAAPDAIFIGGGLDNADIVNAAWAGLPKDGRLVVNAVTLEGQALLMAAREQHGGELVAVQIGHMNKIGDRHVLTPKLPVLQWRAVK